MGVRPVPGMAITYIGEYDDNQPLYLEPGQLALILYVHPLPHLDISRTWWYRCPCGNGGALSGHIVQSTDPVTISPSIVCPGGCHYYIRNGVIV